MGVEVADDRLAVSRNFVQREQTLVTELGKQGKHLYAAAAQANPHFNVQAFHRMLL